MITILNLVLELCLAWTILSVDYNSSRKKPVWNTLEIILLCEIIALVG
jgi:hypothetical protein